MRTAIAAVALMLPLAATAGAPAHTVEVRIDDADAAQRIDLRLGTSRTRTRGAQDAEAEPFEVRTLRESLDAGWRRRFDAWQVDAGLRVERRHGTSVAGGTFGSTGGNVRAAVLAAPVDHETREWRFSATWQRDAMLFRIEGLLAAFENAHRSLQWQNPFPAVAGWVPGAADGIGALAEAPDNRAHDFVVAWAWQSPGGVRLDADAGLGQHEQNEPLLPYTMNPVLAVTRGLPRASLDGRVDRRRMQARLRVPMTHTTAFDARWRAERSDDRTAPALFLYPAGDVANQPATPASGRARWRLPRDFRRERIDAGWQWRSARRDRVRVELGHEAIERAYAEVAETRETRFAAEWRRNGARNAHLRVERATRDSGAYRDNLPWHAYHTDAYIETVAPGMRFENHPLLRRFNLADRERTAVRAGLGSSWGAWHAGLLGSYRDDAYGDSVFGLTDSTQVGVHLDVGYAVTGSQHLSTWVSLESWESRQDGRHFRGGGFFAADFGNPDRDWRAVTDDQIRGLGVNWRHDAPWRDGSIGLDLSHMRSRAEVAVAAGPAISTAPLRPVVADISRASLEVAHRFGERLSVRAAATYERWRSRDWATDGVTPTTVSGVLGLTEGFPDRGLSWASVSVEWRF
ncbi:MAG: MtrB/PioB family outer membrane beta-barrel protein [Gammaproteobacteria bacterium]